MKLGLPWDQPVPEELWIKVAEYCDNDVIATEAAFNYLEADWTARQILADLAEMTVNDTTNSLTTRIIFGNNRKPQSEFHYRNLAEPVESLDKESMDFLKEACPKMMEEPHYGWKYNDKDEVPFEAHSILPYFPGYVFDHGKSTYRGEEVGEGGFAQGVPGMYGNAALLDISSMHPHSAIAEVLFGPRFTKAFRDIVEGRVSIKHEAWDIVNTMLDGKLTPYIQRVIDGEMTSKDLANALKTAINSVYGLTSASFDNPFRDPRNIDNIVAKRGALFMIDLKNEVLSADSRLLILRQTLLRSQMQRQRLFSSLWTLVRDTDTRLSTRLRMIGCAWLMMLYISQSTNQQKNARRCMVMSLATTKRKVENGRQRVLSSRFHMYLRS